MQHRQKLTPNPQVAMRVATCSAFACAVFWLAVGSAESFAQAIEAPPIVIRSNTQESTIWAQDRAGAPSTNGTQTIQSTTGAGTATGTVNATGANTVLSTTQVAQPSSVVVAGDEPCDAAPRTWDGTCTATLPKTFSGQSVTATADAPNTGSATFACQAGTWQPPTGVSCTTFCPAAPVTWGSCSGTAGAQVEGQSQTVGNATGGFTGSGNFSCTAAGTFAYTGGACNAAPPPTKDLYAAFTCTKGDYRWGCNQLAVYCSYGSPSSGSYPVVGGLVASGSGGTLKSMRESAARRCYQVMHGLNIAPANPSIGQPGFVILSQVGTWWMLNGQSPDAVGGINGYVGSGQYSSPDGWHWVFTRY